MIALELEPNQLFLIGNAIDIYSFWGINEGTTIRARRVAVKVKDSYFMLPDVEMVNISKYTEVTPLCRMK